MKVKLIAILLAALFTLAACSTPTENKEQTENTPQPQNQESISDVSGPSFTAKDYDGMSYDESVFSGYKLTMINLWATYCSPCLSEMPDLNEINNEYTDKSFRIIGVVSDVSEQYAYAAKEVAADVGAEYLQLVLSESLLNEYFKDAQYVPTTVFVDENGNTVGNAYIGSRSKTEWTEIIDGLLVE